MTAQDIYWHTATGRSLVRCNLMPINQYNINFTKISLGYDHLSLGFTAWCDGPFTVPWVTIVENWRRRSVVVRVRGQLLRKFTKSRPDQLVIG